MSNETADQITADGDRRGLFDLAFPVCFGIAAIVLTVLWFAAIGWIAWQPVHLLLKCAFE